MIDGMILKISEGNSKIGRTSNLSLPPIGSCRIDAPCIHDCYAMKAWRQYPAVRKAWQSNFDLYKRDPDRFFGDLCLYLAMKKPERFRLHVGGDFIDELYFVKMAEVFASYPATSCLVFTKKYDYPLYAAPPNMKVVLSMWPGLDIPVCVSDFPCAWLEEDTRRPTDVPYILCPGSCDSCEFQCWNGLSLELPVIFKRH